MYMNKITTLLSLACMIMLATGCSSDSDDNGDGPDGRNKPGWTIQSGKSVSEAPVWEPVTDELLTSSMTVTLTLDETFSQADIEPEDMIAAFGPDNECLGCSKVSFMTGRARFYVYVLPPSDLSKRIAFTYYSTTDKKIYCWDNYLTFENNKIVGSVKEPHVLNRNQENHGCLDNIVAFVDLSPIKSINWNRDEFALFVGDECRMTASKDAYVAAENILAVRMPVDNYNEKVSLHYYSHAEDRIYVSQEFGIEPSGICNISKPVMQ